jgi:hypothetical protein
MAFVSTRASHHGIVGTDELRDVRLIPSDQSCGHACRADHAEGHHATGTLRDSARATPSETGAPPCCP